MNSSQTHRLVHFKGAPRPEIDDSKSVAENVAGSGYVPVPNYVADEVEELREFINFLYPQRGQDRFKLCRPDINELRWTVVAKNAEGTGNMFSHHTYAGGDTPRLAVLAARHRLASEHESERTLTPFSIEPQPETD